MLGILLMAVAMLTVPAVDGLAKHLSAGYSPLFISWARYSVACLVVLPYAVATHGSRVFPSEERGSHFLRTAFLVTAMTLYFLSIARIPLATAVSAYFIGPIVAVVLAVVLLKERITGRKILGLALGVIGSIVIVRPGISIDPNILLAIGSGIFFACYLIATRHAARTSDPIKTLAFQCVAGTVLLTPQAIASWSVPAPSDLPFFAGLGVLSAACHMLAIVAFRHASASTLAPLVYLELIGAALVGFVGFGEVPSVATIVGAGCIVAGGIVLLQRRGT